MVRGPFEVHVREAIRLNRERMPLYAGASAGVSLAVSRRLIRDERLLLPLARWFDRRAAPYHACGVPLLEAVFEPMAGVPEFAASWPVPAALHAGAVPSARITRRRVADGLRREGFAGAAAALVGELAGLARVPHAWCMYRHLLESALRVCQVAPVGASDAATLGLPSPLRLLRLLLQLHLYGLAEAVRIDTLARRVQRLGIPILIRDLPAIPAQSLPLRG